MSRYDGLIIPRSYSEYINKTDAATLSQALQLNGVLAQSVSGGNNAAVTSNAVNSALKDYIKSIKVYWDLSQLGTTTNWVTKTVSLPTQANKPLFATIYGMTDQPALLTYWGFELRIVSVDGNTLLFGIRKTVSESWNQNLTLEISYI